MLGTMVDKSFYEVIAQIIPVLMLTMAVGETRVRVRDTISPRGAILGVLLIGAVLVAGELSALRAIETGYGTELTKDLAVFAVAVGLGWVVRSLAAIVHRDCAEGEDEEPPPEIALLIDGSFVVTAVGVVLVLVL
jgi:hypothetical protein